MLSRHNFYIPDTEWEFPLAFAIAFHDSPQQIVRFLKVIYRPLNIYCLHPDGKWDYGAPKWTKMMFFYILPVLCLSSMIRWSIADIDGRLSMLRWSSFDDLMIDRRCRWSSFDIDGRLSMLRWSSFDDLMIDSRCRASMVDVRLSTLRWSMLRWSMLRSSMFPRPRS